MNKYLIAVVFSMLMVIGGPTFAYAQDGMQNGGTTTTGETGGTTKNNDEGGFNWMWLLPLLAIPLLFMFKKDKKMRRGLVTQRRILQDLRGDRRIGDAKTTKSSEPLSNQKRRQRAVAFFLYNKNSL